MKPISTLMQPLARSTFGPERGEAVRERSDVCALPAAGVVGEAMVAIVLAAAVLEKFGGDSIARAAAQRRRLPRPDRSSHRASSPALSWRGVTPRARRPDRLHGLGQDPVGAELAAGSDGATSTSTRDREAGGTSVAGSSSGRGEARISRAGGRSDPEIATRPDGASSRPAAGGSPTRASSRAAPRAPSRSGSRSRRGPAQSGSGRPDQPSGRCSAGPDPEPESRSLMAEREPLYRRAVLWIDTDGRSPCHRRPHRAGIRSSRSRPPRQTERERMASTKKAEDAGRGRVAHQGEDLRGFLPEGLPVAASMGHVRDLPESASEIPPKFKGKEWARSA
jgi:hypothetical protein